MSRILHITECYAGGVRRAINTAISLTPEHDHHLLWMGTEGPPAVGQFTTALRMPTGLWQRIAAVHTMHWLIKPSVVHAHSSWAGVYARALPLRATVVYQPHGYKFDDPEIHAVARALVRLAERLLSANSSAVAVLSPHEKSLARQISARVPTFLVPNAASVASARALDSAEPTQAPTEVIMIGRLSRQKDPAFFARVASKMRKRMPHLRFRWIGDGDPAYRAQLEAAGVEITGWLNDEDLMAALLRPAIYLHSALYEGFPLSILDAAAFGLPIIARRIDALEGTPLQLIDSVDDAVADITAVVTDTASRCNAIDGGRLLLEEMNPTSQTAALRTIYAAFHPLAAVGAIGAVA